jgi:hypothetical protein
MEFSRSSGGEHCVVEGSEEHPIDRTELSQQRKHVMGVVGYRSRTSASAGTYAPPPASTPRN